MAAITNLVTTITSTRNVDGPVWVVWVYLAMILLLVGVLVYLPLMGKIDMLLERRRDARRRW